jgi:ferric-dicitrate binding protein FerR (iron transport regulator)
VALGSVEIIHAARHIPLHADQQVRYGRESGSVSKVDMQAAPAWTRGRLSFESSPLVFVASELNRYSNQRVVLMGPAIGSLSVTGAVDLNNVSGWLDALALSKPLHVLHLYHLTLLY